MKDVKDYQSGSFGANKKELIGYEKFYPSITANQHENIGYNNYDPESNEEPNEESTLALLGDIDWTIFVPESQQTNTTTSNNTSTTADSSKTSDSTKDSQKDGKKNKWLLWLIVGVVVLVTGIIIYKKIKK